MPSGSASSSRIPRVLPPMSLATASAWAAQLRHQPELVRVQKVFGYGREDLERILEPMYLSAKEPIGSMGDDTPVAALSA